jgi:hypothetical protein
MVIQHIMQDCFEARNEARSADLGEVKGSELARHRQHVLKRVPLLLQHCITEGWDTVATNDSLPCVKLKALLRQKYPTSRKQ